jgi:hypothetical protein
MITVSAIAPTTENGLIAFIRRHPVISMSILTPALAWPGLIWEALYSQGLMASESSSVGFGKEHLK